MFFVFFLSLCTQVPKEALLFIAVTKFVQRHKHTSKCSKQARHMAELERYYRDKAKHHHPHVIGTDVTGRREVERGRERSRERERERSRERERERSRERDTERERERGCVRRVVAVCQLFVG